MKQRQRPIIQADQRYMRLATKDSDESGEETELFVKKPPFQDVPTIDKTVEEGDTLQALSIRYHCPISELKRLNNIHRENEIFAKRTIKVPARPFSMALAIVHTSGSSSPDDQVDAPKKGVDAALLKSKLNDKFLNVPGASNSNGSSNATVEVNSVIFNSTVKPASRNCDNVNENQINEVSEEQIRLLPGPLPTAETIVTRLSCSGVDADISWIALIVGIVIIIFVGPLILALYAAEQTEQYHHSHYS